MPNLNAIVAGESIAFSRSFKTVTRGLTDAQRASLAVLIDADDAGAVCWNLVERFTVSRSIADACEFAAKHQTDLGILAVLKRIAEIAS